MYNYCLHLRTFLIIKKKQFQQAISTNKTNAYTPFVILCEPRSGSTLLHTYLNYHPHIKSYGEVLREKIERDRDTSPDPLTRFIFKPHAHAIRAVGLKLFYFYQSHPLYADCFKQISDNKNVKVIHLIRKDVTALYASLKIAEHTGVWSSVRTTRDKVKNKIHIDEEMFRMYATDYARHQQFFQALFQAHQVLHITYEDLSSRPDYILNTVQHFLGVKQKKLFTLLKKQHAASYESVIDNYAAVKAIADEIQHSQLIG